jgi:hypothetical protein
MKFNEKPNPSCEFFFVRELTHSVSAKAWHDGSKWMWNVYAYVQSSHPKFDDNDALQNLPFNGGCTHDSIRITQPTEIKYDWQQRVTTKIVGSDYNHIHDNYYNHPSPFERIPYEVLRDAKDLAEALEVRDGL